MQPQVSDTVVWFAGAVGGVALVLLVNIFGAWAFKRRATRVIFALGSIVAFLTVIGTLNDLSRGARLGERWLVAAVGGLVGACGLLLYVWGLTAWRWRGEKKVGPLCPSRRCGYSLAGIAEPTACPECGRRLEGVSERRLFRTPRRRIAAWTGRALLAAAVVAPVAVRVGDRGWIGALPDWLLVRIALTGTDSREMTLEMGTRGISLQALDPAWTRRLMETVAADYDSTSGKLFTGSGRFYALYQPAMDDANNRLLIRWLESGTPGQKFVAAFIANGQGRLAGDQKVRLLPALLESSDPVLRTTALRALANERAWPLEDLLACSRRQPPVAPLTELDAALRSYDEPAAMERRFELACVLADPQSRWVTMSILMQHVARSDDAASCSALKRLAHDGASPPAAGATWSGTGAASFYAARYKFLVETAVGAHAEDGADSVTELWCRRALASLCTPGFALTPPRPIITGVIDEQIQFCKDPEVLKRLRSLKDECTAGAVPAPR